VSQPAPLEPIYTADVGERLTGVSAMRRGRTQQWMTAAIAIRHRL